MQIAFLLFDGITALDAVGPYEVLERLPGADARFVGKERGVVRTDNGSLGLAVGHTLDEVTRPDLLLVPGGWGTRALESDETVLAWVREAHRHTTWTTSVCTGALVLAAAGLLDGLEATTHWAWRERLAEHGARPVGDRIVFAGNKIASAAGVSAGIDLALALAAKIGGPELAQALQLGIEYDPQPPFDAGSVDKAPAPIVAAVRARLAAKADPSQAGG